MVGPRGLGLIILRHYETHGAGQVEEETTNKRGETTKVFVNTKLMTRQTYTLDGVEGDLSVRFYFGFFFIFFVCVCACVRKGVRMRGAPPLPDRVCVLFLRTKPPVDSTPPPLLSPHLLRQVGEGGKIKFEEKDGIDYAATTVQLPGGERVPMLFTVKELVATASQPGRHVHAHTHAHAHAHELDGLVWKGVERGSVGLGLSVLGPESIDPPSLCHIETPKNSAIKPGFQFGGSFQVPSYRTGLFLDPKGRGAVTGACLWLGAWSYAYHSSACLSV